MGGHQSVCVVYRIEESSVRCGWEQRGRRWQRGCGWFVDLVVMAVVVS